MDEMYIEEKQTIMQALKQLDKSSRKILFVHDNGKLLATVSDGDIRRWILQKGNLYDPVKCVANYHPKYLYEDQKSMAKKVMKEYLIDTIPIVDKNRRITSIVSLNREEREENKLRINIPVVIMAGGLGSRLYPYTKILPKPLIPIADTPISERIIQSFQKIGCEEFHMIVNYKKNMIKAYFNDNDCGYNIHFWDEEIPLGTGGGLFLLKDNIDDTFVLTNCDILILDDLRKIVAHHKENKNDVTMVCSLKNFEIPYGVVKFSEGGEISSFEEKPRMSFYTNTGYYILERDIFDSVSPNEKIGMPDLIERMQKDGKKIGIYPISENNWLDMGQFDTMESMERKLNELNL